MTLFVSGKYLEGKRAPHITIFKMVLKGQEFLTTSQTALRQNWKTKLKTKNFQKSIPGKKLSGY